MRGGPTLRTLATLWAAAIGVLVLLVVVGLIATSTLLHRSVAPVVRDAESRAIASQLEVTLLGYQRTRNLYVVTGQDELLQSAREDEQEVTALLARAEAFVGSPSEEALLDEAAADVRAYLDARERAEAEATRLAEVVAQVQPSLDAALNAVEAVRQVNERQLAEAEARAAQVNELADTLGGTAAVLALLALVATTLGVRHYVIRPVLALHDTIERYEAGVTDVRAETIGVHELADLAGGFNAMADTLARQREAQLAFLAGVAHDLKNPLSAIKIGLRLLRSQLSDEQRLLACDKLDGQIDRLARMVDDLLDATRIESGNLELRPQEVDLRDVVRAVVGLYGPTTTDHELRVTVGPAPVLVHADPLRLEQVVSNLLSNAIKYSPEGGPVEVAVGAEACAVISVSDHGIGIPADQLQAIFQPFRRHRQDVAPGVGLGLSVVRRIVQAHGGHIEVESQPGAGTTFRVMLPLATRREAPRPPLSAHA